VIFTEKMTKQTQQIADYEYEISLLRKQIEALETEREKDKKKISDLEELLAKAREVLASYSPTLICMSVRLSLFLQKFTKSLVCLHEILKKNRLNIEDDVCEMLCWLYVEEASTSYIILNIVLVCLWYELSPC